MLAAGPLAAEAKKHAPSAESGKDSKSTSSDSGDSKTSARSAIDAKNNLDDLLDGRLPPAKEAPTETVITGSAGHVREQGSGGGYNRSNGDLLPESPSSSPDADQPIRTPESATSSGPVNQTSLKGNVRRELAGSDANPEPGLEGETRLAPRTKPVLQGNASMATGGLGASQDPDSEDRQLMIEWDRWRNRFLMAVQMQVQAGVNHPDFEDDIRPRIDPRTGFILARFPMGTETWFSCEISSDRRILNLEIIKPSGIAAYDRSVLEGVRALDGTSMLIYPRGSKRAKVSQRAGIRTSDRAEYQYHHFGDVERTRE